MPKMEMKDIQNDNHACDYILEFAMGQSRGRVNGSDLTQRETVALGVMLAVRYGEARGKGVPAKSAMEFSFSRAIREFQESMELKQ